jgi:nucleoside-diphosphate-sugar epimerase
VKTSSNAAPHLGRSTVVQEPLRVRTSERMLLAADIERIRRETQWTPRVSLENTLRDLIAAYRLQTQSHSAP